MWPFLWPSPFSQFAEAFQAFSIYKWGGQVLFAGVSYHSWELPWTYLPVWFCISMPIIWLILGFAGIIWSVILFIKKPFIHFDNNEKRNRMWYFSMFIIPCLIIMITAIWIFLKHISTREHYVMMLSGLYFTMFIL